MLPGLTYAIGPEGLNQVANIRALLRLKKPLKGRVGLR